MKNILILGALCASLLLSSFAMGATDQPTGYLNASSLLVRASSNVDLDWKVQFPGGNIEEIVEIDEQEDTVKTRTKTKVKVRLIGSGYQDVYGRYGPIQSYSKFSDESRHRPFFIGTGNRINPNKVLKSRTVRKNIELNFASRGVVSGTEDTPWWRLRWNGWRTMGVGHGGIIILKNGDPAPDFTPEYDNQISAETFLLPYLSEDAKTIKIGSRDVIVLVDLNKSSAEEGADYQDLVFLMTFKDENDDDDDDDD